MPIYNYISGLCPWYVVNKVPFLVPKAWPGRSTSYVEALLSRDAKVGRKAFEREYKAELRASCHCYGPQRNLSGVSLSGGIAWGTLEAKRPKDRFLKQRPCTLTRERDWDGKYVPGRRLSGARLLCVFMYISETRPSLRDSLSLLGLP